MINEVHGLLHGLLPGLLPGLLTELYTYDRDANHLVGLACSAIYHTKWLVYYTSEAEFTSNLRWGILLCQDLRLLRSELR